MRVFAWNFAAISSVAHRPEFPLSPRRKAAIAFTTAIVLLTIGGVATGVTVWNLLESLRWLAHSYQVEVALGDIDSTLTRAARARAVYVQDGDPDYYRQFGQSLNAIAPELGNMESLISDNPLQTDMIKRLEDVTQRRVELLQKSVKLRHDGLDNAAMQADIGRDSLGLGLDQSDLIHQMQANESGLIGQRRRISDRQFIFVLALLGLTFITSALLFWWHFALLRDELLNRAEMEEATRRLSSHVLEMQDEERRRFSRELHDSLGQILTAAKLNMSALMKTYPQYLGIGLDEATAIIVQGSIAEVIGRGKTHFYDARRKAAEGQPDYEALPAGGRYDLKSRKVLQTP